LGRFWKKIENSFKPNFESVSILEKFFQKVGEKIRVCFSKREKREEFFPKSGGNRERP
jgi:hypothetical protein